MTKSSQAPSEQLCDFLANSLPQVGDYEKLEGLDLARRLADLYDGPPLKPKVSVNDVLDTFPWLCQLGLIDYERQFTNRGGYRIFIWRKASPMLIKTTIAQRFDVVFGKPCHIDKLEPVTDASLPKVKAGDVVRQNSPEEPKPKKKKRKCCDEPRVVRSKKTGKRRCKNCGAKYKTKKVNR